MVYLRQQDKQPLQIRVAAIICKTLCSRFLQEDSYRLYEYPEAMPPTRPPVMEFFLALHYDTHQTMARCILPLQEKFDP